MNNFKQKPPEVKFESVQVKRFKDVSQDKGPNWWFIISMPDGIEYKGYASEDCQQLSDIVIQNNNNEIETIVGMTGHQVSKPNYEFQDCKFYYEGKSLTAKTVVQKQSPKPITNGNSFKGNGLQRTDDYSQVNTSKDDAMTKTGISTRGGAAILYGLTVANRAWSKTDTHNLKEALKAAKDIDVIVASVGTVPSAPPTQHLDNEEIDDEIPF